MEFKPIPHPHSCDHTPIDTDTSTEHNRLFRPNLDSVTQTRFDTQECIHTPTDTQTRIDSQEGIHTLTDIQTRIDSQEGIHTLTDIQTRIDSQEGIHTLTDTQTRIDTQEGIHTLTDIQTRIDSQEGILHRHDDKNDADNNCTGSSGQPKRKRLDDYTLYERDDSNCRDDFIVELQLLIEAFTLVSNVCVRDKRHLYFHVSSLIVELLCRRLDYVRHGGKVVVTRITYPSHMLVGWLKFLYVRLKRCNKENTEDVPHGLCDPTCNARFNVPPRYKQHDMSYLLGAPYTCGPSSPAPIHHDSLNMDDMYELKYVYLAARLIMSSFKHTSHPAVPLINGIVELLGAREKSIAGYNEKLTSFAIEYRRLQIHHALEEYKKGLLESYMEYNL